MAIEGTVLLQGWVRKILVILLASASLQVIASDKFISRAMLEQLQLPEARIDIGTAALVIAKEVYLDLDVQAYSRKLDTLADKVRWLAKGTLDPEQRIRVLNTVLFKYEGFHYDRAAFSRSRQEYYYLNGILDTKKGICYTMPLLYVAVAQRAGYPIYPVMAPDHIFVRYVEPSFTRQNVETTSGGKYFPDEFYIKDFSVSSRGLKSGSYMRTMTYREFLGHILVASSFALRRDGHKTLAYIEKAAELHPQFADFHLSLSEGYLAKSKVVTREAAVLLEEKAKLAATKARQLGYVSQSEIALGREIRGRSQ